MRKILTIAILFSCLSALPLWAEDYWEPQIEESFLMDAPSDDFYNIQIESTFGSGGPILRGFGSNDNDENGFEGGGGTDSDDFVDAPIGDGILVFILGVVFYISIILLRSRDRYLQVLKGNN